MSARISLSSAILLILLGSQARATTIQDFEGGSIAPGTAGAGYSDFGPCGAGTELYPEGSYAVTSNAQSCHDLWFATTAQEGSLFLAVNGLTAIGPVYQQTVLGLNPGDTYILDAWFAGLYSVNPADITWEIIAGGTAPVNSFLTNTTGAWDQNGVTFVATGSTLTFNISINTTLASGNDFGLDNITLDDQTTAIPEPATMLLVGLGLVGFALTRSRKT